MTSSRKHTPKGRRPSTLGTAISFHRRDSVQGDSLKPTQREESVKAAILEDPEANHAFRIFIKRGFNENALLTSLCNEAWGPGVLLETIGNPDSLGRAEASEMSDRLLQLSRRLKRETDQLPHDTLTRCLTDLIRTARELRTGPWKLPIRRETQTQFTLMFLNEIKGRTQHYSLNHAAALLKVTHGLADRGDRVSRDSLRSLLKTHRTG